MKTCGHCGYMNDDNRTQCRSCHRSLSRSKTQIDKFQYAGINVNNKISWSILIILVPLLLMIFKGVTIILGGKYDFVYYENPYRKYYLPHYADATVLGVFVLLICFIMAVALVWLFVSDVWAHRSGKKIKHSEISDRAVKNRIFCSNVKSGKISLWLLVPVIVFGIFLFSSIMTAQYGDSFVLVILGVEFVTPELPNPTSAIYQNLLIIAVLIIRVIIQCSESKKYKKLIAEENIKSGERIKEEISEQNNAANTEDPENSGKSIGFYVNDPVVTEPIGYMSSDGVNLLRLCQIDRLPKIMIPENAQNITLNELFVSASERFERAGVNPDKNLIRSLISCVASSRLICLNMNDKNSTGAVSLILSSVFGFKSLQITSDRECKNFAEMLTVSNGQIKQDSDLFGLLYSAKCNPNVVCPVVISDAELSEKNEYIQAIIDFSNSEKHVLPLSVGRVDTGSMPKNIDVAHNSVNRFDSMADTYFSVSKNVWFFVDYLQRGTINQNIAQAAFIVDADVKLKNDYSIKDFTPLVSYERFDRLIRQSRDDKYLPEECWKKIDKLSAFMSERFGLVLGNKLYRQLEAYTSVFLSCGGENNDALDSAVSMHILPLLSSVDAEKIKDTNEQTGIKDFMERVFGAENIPMSLKTLSKMNLA